MIAVLQTYSLGELPGHSKDGGSQCLYKCPKVVKTLEAERPIGFWHCEMGGWIIQALVSGLST